MFTLLHSGNSCVTMFISTRLCHSTCSQLVCSMQVSTLHWRSVWCSPIQYFSLRRSSSFSGKPPGFNEAQITLSHSRCTSASLVELSKTSRHVHPIHVLVLLKSGYKLVCLDSWKFDLKLFTQANDFQLENVQLWQYFVPWVFWHFLAKSNYFHSVREGSDWSLHIYMFVLCAQ